MTSLASAAHKSCLFQLRHEFAQFGRQETLFLLSETIGIVSITSSEYTQADGHLPDDTSRCPTRASDLFRGRKTNGWSETGRNEQSVAVGRKSPFNLALVRLPSLENRSSRSESVGRRILSAGCRVQASNAGCARRIRGHPKQSRRSGQHPAVEAQSAEKSLRISSGVRLEKLGRNM